MDIFEKQQRVEAIREIIKVRWFSILVMLVLAAVIKTKYFGGWGEQMDFFKISVLGVIGFGYNFVYWFFIKRPAERIGNLALEVVAASQVVVDQILFTVLVYFSGTVESMLYLLYFIPLLIAGSLYRAKGIILTGSLAIFLGVGVTLLDHFRLIPHVYAFPGTAGWFGHPYMLLVKMASFTFYVIVGIYFSVALSNLFRRREKAFKEQHAELMKKSQILIGQTKKLMQAKNWLHEALVKSDKARLELASAKADESEAKQKAEKAKVATLNILEDIEEARKAQEAERNKAESVIRSLTDGLIMLDGQGKLALVNAQAEKILRVKKEDIIGQKIEKLDAPAIKELNRLIKSEKGNLSKKEIGFSKQKGSVFEVSTASVLGGGKENKGKIVVLHDITREKAIEKMKSEFVSIAAHQLRTPLSAIKWSIKLILDKDLGEITKEQEKILEKGYQSNERMIALINDLLNVTRIEEGRFVYKFSQVPFFELVQEVLDNFQQLIKRKGLKIKFEKPKIACLIKADEEKIILVLQNLIENAINYSPDRSSMTISFRCDNMKLTFMIKDDGIGIPKEQQPRIFSKFFRGDNAIRRETEGTGLGLFICKNIIESHGGRIWFESEENKGSTFYFELPIIKTENNK